MVYHQFHQVFDNDVFDGDIKRVHHFFACFAPLPVKGRTAPNICRFEQCDLICCCFAITFESDRYYFRRSLCFEHWWRDIILKPKSPEFSWTSKTSPHWCWLDISVFLFLLRAYLCKQCCCWNCIYFWYQGVQKSLQE